MAVSASPSPPSDGTKIIWCPHVTVATIVANDNQQYLMVEEEIRDQIRYNQPAGHVDAGESLIDAAKREALEETGYDIRIDYLVGIYQWWSPLYEDHVLRFCFSGTSLGEHRDYQLDDGIIRSLWLDYEQIMQLGNKLRGPTIKAGIDAWRAGEKCPLGVLKNWLPHYGERASS